MSPKDKKEVLERVPYRFTLYRAQDEEIIEFLDSIPKPLRGRVILQALKLLKGRFDFMTGETKKSVKFDNSFNF